jgi:hypothetical protein
MLFGPPTNGVAIMTKSLRIVALAAAALVSGTASATKIAVGESRLVIDVEFWGREYGRAEGPNGGGDDIIVFGDPVHGSFRISVDDAPAAGRPPSGIAVGGKGYGGTLGSALPTGAAFVTSRWLSPLPTMPLPSTPGDVVMHQVSQFPGSVADDLVAIGDRVQMRNLPASNITDFLQITDKFRENTINDRYQEVLQIAIGSPSDIIHGEGLDQEFEIDDLQETEGAFSYGFFRNIVGETVQLLEFVVDRVRVTPHVCKP